MIPLFFTLVFLLLGFGIIIPLLSSCVQTIGTRGSSPGLLMASFAIIQFMCAPVWETPADRYERKPISFRKLALVGTSTVETTNLLGT